MNPFIELFSALFDMYVAVVLLRFFLQYFKADYFNPLSQFVIKITDPLVKPLRRIIPGFAGIDFSTLILAWLLEIIKMLLVMGIAGQFSLSNPIILVLFALVHMVDAAIMLFVFLIFIRIILSFVNPASYNPMIAVLSQLTEPLLSAARRRLPATQGFDLSPMIILLLLYFVRSSIHYFLVPLITQ